MSLVKPDDNQAAVFLRMGECIRRFRKNLGMTQGVLAAATGVSRPSICQIESGQQRARTETLIKIADALGVQLDDLTEASTPCGPLTNAEQSISMGVSAQAYKYLVDLTSTGLWGSTVEQTARILLLESLRAHTEKA